MANVIAQLNPIQSYAVAVFDGVFSDSEISSHRNRVFYRVANFRSPKTNKALGEVLNEEEIGSIINELDNLQFQRKLQGKIARAGEASF